MDERQILDAARCAAARRQYRLALSLADIVEDEPLKLEAMMLRGKIHAQMGRYDEAIKAWKEVLAKAPDNQKARDAIHKAEQIQKSPIARHLPRIKVAAAAGVMLCLLLLMAGSFALGRRTTAGEHARTRELAQDLLSHVGGISDDTVSRVLASQAEQQRETLLKAVDGLQQHVQAVVDHQTALVAKHLDNTTGETLAALGETRDKLSVVQEVVAKEQTTAEMVKAMSDFQAEAIRLRGESAEQMQSVLVRLQEIQDRQAPMLETYAADRQIMVSVMKSMESFQQGLSAAQDQISQIMGTQAVDGKTLGSVVKSMESFQQGLSATQRQGSQIVDTQVTDGEMLASAVKSMESLQQRLSAVQNQVSQIVNTQVTDGKTLASVSQSAQSFRQDLAMTKDLIAKERERSQQMWHMTVEILRPANMDWLTQQIKEVNETRVALQAKERNRPKKSGILGVLLSSNVPRRLQETEERCKMLQDQWDREIVPWMQAQEAALAFDGQTSGPRDGEKASPTSGDGGEATIP